jgi:hypothetical protein
MALRYALYPGMASAVMLVTTLQSGILPAWGNEVASQTSSAEYLLGEFGSGQLAALPSPLRFKPGLVKPDSNRSGTIVRFRGEEAEQGFAGEAIALEATPPDGTGAAEPTAPLIQVPVQEPALEPLEPLELDPLVPADILAPAERSEVFTQAAYLQEGGDISARLRVGGIYVLSPSVFAGITVDLTAGQAFAETDPVGLSLNELYLTASPANLPELRFTAGMMDLTSYLDRNSFAKDVLTQFFNPVFQTNPALVAVNVSSRPGALVNWTPVDQVSLTATTFSASRGLDSFALDSFAGELGVRLGHVIVRGTYVTSVDTGQSDSFAESFTFDRGNGQFGTLPGDRETSFGLNAEAFIPGINLGLFGRYGWYTNETLGASGQTYSLGVNGLDVFLPGDRLGLGYGRQLSNTELQQASGDPVPDVLELFYDAQIIDNLRAGVSVQQLNGFTETYLGFRVRYDLRWNPLRRAAE